MRPRPVVAALFALLALALPALAEEEAKVLTPEDGWLFASDINLTLTQNAYSDNWEGGESGAISWALNSNSLAERQLTDIINSRNTLKLAFGQTHSQDQSSKRWLKPSKTTDLIDAEGVFRFSYGWVVDPFASARVESRFLDTRDPSESRMLNPMTLTESAGVARVLIKEENREWTTRLGAALRQHIDRDALADGETERETVSTSDAGLQVVSQLRTPLADGAVSLTSDLTIFQALYYSEADALEGLPGADEWKSPDVNWENTFSAGITDHIVVNLYLQLLYDRQIDDGLRLKETLSLGLTFRLL